MRFIPLPRHLPLALLGAFGCVIVLAAHAENLRPKGTFTLTAADRAHWAFQPLRDFDAKAFPSAPATIDRFIDDELRSRGLHRSPSASKETLIRRVTLDLTGLPPSLAEIDAFLNDSSPESYERLLNRLLKSPHYGERWGRHWLDLVRFAETDGFEHDAVRPHAWRYRDYIIKSFNDDKPYDQFIREQLAGDQLLPDDPQALVATGFALLGPDMVDSSDQVQRRHNTLNDATDTTASVFLGLTFGCARCHDHKFEPLSQRDYYRLQAFFTPSNFDREHPIPSPAERTAYDAAQKQYQSHPEVQALIDLEAPARDALFKKKLKQLTPEAQEAHLTAPEKRTAEQVNLVLETISRVKLGDKDVANALSGNDRQRRQQLIDQLKAIPKPGALPKAMALEKDATHPQPTFILRRGEYSMPLDEVTPDSPEVLPGHPSSSERAALAEWIASPVNPLTARVMVNRIWQHHFGRGLVATPSDFGVHGSKPSHPALLDWLAHEFIASGWSMKHMHKLILMSETYQQRSSGILGNGNDGKMKKLPHSHLPTFQSSIDPENFLLWRMNRLRLEGEVIRDSLLAISGQLNLDMGGPGIFPPVPKEVVAGSKSGWPQNDRAREYNRRSIYIFARRNLRFPFLEVFDAPDSNLSCPARERSTTAPQSLTLLNADEVTTAAAQTAAHLQKEARSTDEQVTLAYRLILSRKPKAKELSLARDFLAKSPLHEFCRALLNLNEFVYAE